MTYKGFTLIELLVVIAIIGILAGTVIVSLSGQTDSATDAQVKLSISSLRSAAITESFKRPTPSGDTICDNVRGKIRGGSSTVATQWTTSSVCTTEAQANDGKLCCDADGTDWVIWAQLSNDKYWCTDGDGRLDEYAAGDIDPTGEYECIP